MIAAQAAVVKPDYLNTPAIAYVNVAINVLVKHAARNRDTTNIVERIGHLLVSLLDYRAYQNTILRALASVLKSTPRMHVLIALIDKLAKMARTRRISFDPDLLLPLNVRMPDSAFMYTPEPRSDPRTSSTGWSSGLHGLEIEDNQYTEHSILMLSFSYSSLYDAVSEYDKLRLMLVMVDNCTDFRSARANEMYTDLISSLTTLAAQLSEETVKEINQDFDAFAALSAHSVDFCKKALRVMLTAEYFTSVNADFMYHIVARNLFAVSVNRDLVVFLDNVRFHLTGIGNTANLAAVIRRLMAEEAAQTFPQPVTAHKMFSAPAFAPACVDTPVAAIDIVGVFSQADRAHTLVSHRQSCTYQTKRALSLWIVTKACLSCSKRRNEFGDLEVHKIRATAHGTFESELSVKHPAAVNSQFIATIFGPMNYLHSKPCFYVSAFQILLSSGDNILLIAREGHIQSDGSDVPVALLGLAAEEGIQSAYMLLRILLFRALEEGSAAADDVGKMEDKDLLRPWAQYAAVATKFSKYNVFDLADGSAQWLSVRQDSLRVDEHLRMSAMVETTDVLSNRLEDVEHKLQNINIGDLEALTIRENLLRSEEIKIEIVQGSPYKCAFYEALRWQLNSVYLACTAISTNMIANESRGIVGSVGSFLESISAHTPLVGIGLSLIGQVLQGIDQSAQEERVEAFVKVTVDSSEMARLAEVVARKIAICIDDLDIKPDPSPGLCKALVENLGNIEAATGDSLLTSGIVALTVMVYGSIKSRLRTAKRSNEAEAKSSGGLTGYMWRFVQGKVQDENDPCVRGETDSEIVAHLLVQQIFKGTYYARLPLQEKQSMMIAVVMEKYERKAKESVSPTLTTAETRLSLLRTPTPSPPTTPSLSSPAPVVDEQSVPLELTATASDKYTTSEKSNPAESDRQEYKEAAAVEASVSAEERIAREAFAVCLMISDCDQLTPASTDKDLRFLLRLSVALRKYSQLLAHPNLEESEVVDVLGRHLQGTSLLSTSPCGTKYCLSSKFLSNKQHFTVMMRAVVEELGDVTQAPVTVGTPPGNASAPAQTQAEGRQQLSGNDGVAADAGCACVIS